MPRDESNRDASQSSTSPPGCLADSKWQSLSKIAFRAARGNGLSVANSWDVSAVVMATLLNRIRELDAPPVRSYEAWVRTIAARRSIDLKRSKEYQASTNVLPESELSACEQTDAIVVDTMHAVSLVETVFEIGEAELSDAQLEAIFDYYHYEGDVESVRGVFRELARRANENDRSAASRRSHFNEACGKLRCYFLRQGIDLNGWESP